MIIVNITGQFGNQMFQYALGRHLEMLGKDVIYYTGYFRKRQEHDLALPRIFGIHLREASRNQVLACREDRHRIIDRIRRKLFGRRERVFTEIGSKVYNYRPDVFEVKRGLIDGYWQSERYFQSVADVICKDYTFLDVSERNRELASEMAANTSVAIHVRRGDYVGCYPVMDVSYYNRAMDYFVKKYDSVHFYVFSNNLSWCRDNLKADKITFVDWNTGKDSPYDMWLMTQCRHNIIANSSFSWWGAWLNKHEGKEVIAPREWFYHAETPDIYCPGWIVI